MSATERMRNIDVFFIDLEQQWRFSEQSNILYQVFGYAINTYDPFITGFGVFVGFVDYEEKNANDVPRETLTGSRIINVKACFFCFI